MAYLLKNLIVSLVILSAGPVFAQSPLTGRAAGNVPQGSIWEEYWLFRKSTLTANSEINMEYYLYGELGNEENMINSLRRNRVQISSASLWGLSATIPEVAVLSLPYLFESPEEADYVYDGRFDSPLSGTNRNHVFGLVRSGMDWVLRPATLP
jgi:TRAP-type transport system periplasmic protein